MDWLREEITELQLASNVPLLTALLLGLLGALSPCQLTTNATAIAFVSRKMAQGRAMSAAIAYLAGKAAVYTVLGLVLFTIGWRTALDTVPMMVWIRKLFGPSLILAGIVMLGLLRFRFSLGQGASDWLQARAPGDGLRGAFFLGTAFALVFCPTLFLLFFTVLIPLAIASQGGALFPVVFAVGTTLPVIIFAIVASLAAIKVSDSLKKARFWGLLLQRGAALAFIGFGVREIFYYWNV